MRNVKAPVLLVYGDEDDIVRPEQSREAYKTLIGLGKTAMIHELPGAGHQIHDQDQRTEMLIIIDRFMIG
jgi:dipeptidyl aminopeptidase/acylaminoacyl peptidase